MLFVLRSMPVFQATRKTFVYLIAGLGLVLGIFVSDGSAGGGSEVRPLAGPVIDGAPSTPEKLMQYRQAALDVVRLRAIVDMSANARAISELEKAQNHQRDALLALTGGAVIPASDLAVLHRMLGI